MANTINTVLNQLLASNYSEASKLAHQQVRPSPPPPPVPAIADAGEAQDAVLTDQQQQNQQRTAQYQQQARRQTLNDFKAPQIAIAPADELNLFATPDAATAAATGNGEIIQSNFVSDETNRARRQALTSNNLADVLRQRAQQAVSSLYARNNDIVYNTSPVVNEAA